MQHFQKQLNQYKWALVYAICAGLPTAAFIYSESTLAPWLFIIAVATLGFIYLARRETYLAVAGVSMFYLFFGGAFHRDNIHVVVGTILTVSGILFLLFFAHRKNAAYELMSKKYDSLLRIPLENPNPIFRVDLDGKILYSNPSGTSHLQSLGTSILGTIPLIWYTSFQLVCESGEAASYEYQTPRGNEWYSAHIVPVEEHGYVNVYVSDVTNLRETQHHLEDQTLFLQNILDTVSTHIFLRDQDGKITLANQAFADFCGTTPEELIGKTNFDLVPDPTVAERIDLEDQAVFESGQDIYIAADAVLHETGEASWLHKIKRPFFSKDGKQTHVMVVATDITDSVLVEQALESERNLLRTLMDHLPDFIFVKDLEGRFVTVNESLRKRINVNSVSEIIGKTDFDFFPTESTNEIFHLEQQLMETGTPSLNQLEQLDDGETPMWALTSKVPLCDKNGEAIGLIGITRDVTSLIDAETELRTAKEQIEEKHQLLDTLINRIPDAILVKDIEGRFVVTNSTYMATYASDHDSIIGKTDYDIHPDMAHKYLAEDQRLIENNESLVEQINLEVSTSTGTESRWLLRTKFPFRDHHGEVTGVIGINRDITDSKQAEMDMRSAKEAAEAADRAKSEFLANMSHEIRTPMNAVIGMSSLLLDTKLDGDQADYVQTIRTSGEMLLAIINDILDFSKIESDKLEIEHHPFPLRSCLEETLALFFATASNKGIELVLDIAGNIPSTIIGDVTRFRQILANLLSNALKFTEKGEIVLTATCKSMPDNAVHLFISVRDTGIGINANKLETLFESFAQADASTTRRYGGTGLGLAISRKLAELMGGKLWAESQEGTGSIFHFECEVAAALPESGIESTHRNSVLADKQMLVVDDNEVNRKLTTSERTIARNGLKESSPSVEPILDSPSAASHRPANSQISPVDTELVDTGLVDKVADTMVAGSVESDKSSSCLAKLNLLLVEDNVVNQKVASKMLERLGYEIEIAQNGVEALEAVKQKQYDIILMDLQMPEMGGIEATIKIREQYEREPRPYIIAMTADAMDGARERCLAVGMDSYITKPVRLDDLSNVIQTALEAIAL